MAGRTSLMAYIQVQDDDEIFLRGFITFINVDADGKPISHGLVLKPLTPEDVTLQKEASTLR